MPTCLVVDDSAVIRTVVRRMLTELDFEVVEAENGRIALDKCSARMPDAIILDWNMPVMNGIDFLRVLRRQETEQPAVLLCTTENDIAHIREALNTGANEYIMKPFDGEILRAKLAQVGLI